MIDRDTIINHILNLMELDIDYARSALRWYHQTLPAFNLIDGVRLAIKAKGVL